MPPPHERPFVLVNMSMTADGKIASANRAIDSFSSARDQAHLHDLRATCDAVLCGAGTVNGPGIRLDSGGPRFQRLRRLRGLNESHLRIVASGQARLSPAADLFDLRSSPVLVLICTSAPPGRVRRLRAVADTVEAFGARELDLNRALQWLHSEWAVRRLVCEGGGKLNAALFRAGLVDELHLTICPAILGGRCAPTIAGGADATSLLAAAHLELKKLRRVRNEFFLAYRVVRLPGSSN